MFSLKMDNWSFDADLQIIHADVRLSAEGEELIDQPLCVDVGLPALLLSVLADVEPDRWAPPEQWEKMPFFVCGCGDPDCRGFSFAVEHQSGDTVKLIEVEEREGDAYRVLGEYNVSLDSYAEQINQAAKTFLTFVKPLDYKPYFKDTVPVVQKLVDQVDHKLENLRTGKPSLT